jgi:DNA-binding NarL/FixJ family response regulator
MPSVPTIRVLLVDDDPLARTGLVSLLGAVADIEVCGEVSDGDEVVSAARELKPGVVLMDLRMPRLNGVEATRLVRALPSPPHVIALTTWDVDDAVVRSLEAGADGFLLKTAAPLEIVAAIRAVMDGDAVLSPRSTRRLLDHVGRRDDAARRAAVTLLGRLTARERDVAIATGHGLTNVEIGTRLYMSAATVKQHLGAVQHKLGVRNRVGVAVLAERAGLLGEPGVR